MIRQELVKLANGKLRDLRDLEAKAAKDDKMELKRQIARKRQILNSILASNPSIDDAPVVFMSYSKRTGEALAAKARREFGEWGIEIRTGFDDEVQVKDDVKAIIERIRGCNIFLGIWTPQYKLREDGHHGEELTVPSVWLLEEKGVAEALDIPIRLLIHESVHEDFYNKTSQGKLKSIFGFSNFETKLHEAITALQLRYNEKHSITYQLGT